MSKKYYFIMMSQKDMFQNQVLEEILRERKTYYAAKKQEIDFWILISPNFLNSIEIQTKILETNYFKQLNSKEKTLACLISLNKEFLDWIKLRLGYFENVFIKKTNENIIYQSSGICGEIEKFSEQNFNPLNTNNLSVERSILVQKYSNVLENVKKS